MFCVLLRKIDKYRKDTYKKKPCHANKNTELQRTQEGQAASGSGGFTNHFKIHRTNLWLDKNKTNKKRKRREGRERGLADSDQ